MKTTNAFQTRLTGNDTSFKKSLCPTKSIATRGQPSRSEPRTRVSLLPRWLRRGWGELQGVSALKWSDRYCLIGAGLKKLSTFGRSHRWFWQPVSTTTPLIRTFFLECPSDPNRPRLLSLPIFFFFQCHPKCSHSSPN
jgi:hypothetical protein